MDLKKLKLKFNEYKEKTKKTIRDLKIATKRKEADLVAQLTEKLTKRMTKREKYKTEQRKANMRSVNANRLMKNLLKTINYSTPTTKQENRNKTYTITLKLYRITLRDNANTDHEVITFNGQRLISLVRTFTTDLITGNIIASYLINHLYLRQNQTKDFKRLISILSFYDEDFKRMFNILDGSGGVDAIKLLSVDESLPIQAHTTEALLNRQYRDDTNVGISCKYTDYSINKQADTFDQLIEQERNDYLKINFRKNCCMLTAIINKFYDRFVNNMTSKVAKRDKIELTYEYLCDVIGLENDDNNISCSIIQSLKFFEKHELGLFVYDSFLNLLFKYEPENKNKNTSSLRVLAKNGHIYQINNNLKSLEKITDDDEIKNIYVSDKYNVGIENNDIKTEIHYVHSNIDKCINNNTNDDEALQQDMKLQADTIISIIKGYDAEEETTVKIIVDGCLDNVLCQIKSGGYEPSVYFNNHIYKLSFQVKKLHVSIELPNIKTQNEQDIYFQNIDEYNHFHTADDVVKSAIMKEEYLSERTKETRDIEDAYPMTPITGYFNSYEKVNSHYTLDVVKAYTSILMNINKIPVFNYFDVYEKYNNEPIQDYTYYIVKNLSSDKYSSILLSDTYTRVYGFMIPFIDFDYKILFYRKPLNIKEVDFKTCIDELYNNESIKVEDKKYIVNCITGLLEKKTNKKSITKIFTDPQEAEYYCIKYSMYKVKKFTIFEDKTIERTNEQLIERYMLYSKCPKDSIDQQDYNHYVNNYFKCVDNKYFSVIKSPKIICVCVSLEKSLVNGFSPIKDIIYSKMRIKLYEAYIKMKSLKVELLGIKTDSLFFDRKYISVMQKNFNIENKIGSFRIEKNKVMTDKSLTVNTNKMIVRLNKVKSISFKDEYDLTEIHEYIKNNNNIIIKADFPGSGKTYAITEYDANTLFIMPNNLQCAEKRKDGFKSITFHKFFGISISGMENQKFKGVNLTDVKTICFDEIYMYEPYLLKRVAKFSSDHPEIKVLSTGDGNQLKPIGFDNISYVDKCVNIVFENQIVLREIKRLNNEEDKVIMRSLKDDIFNTDLTIEQLCIKYGLNMIRNMKDVKTLKNISLFKRRADDVNKHIHNNVLKLDGLIVGQEIICKKRYKNKSMLINVNYIFVIKSIKGDNIVIEDTNDNDTFTIDNDIFNEYFKLPYCNTLHSIQGATIKDKITIFDCNTAYADKRFIWTAITRCVSLDHINFFIHDERDVKSLNRSRIDLYINSKIEGYKLQDKKACRKIENFVNINWFYNNFDLNYQYCKYCDCRLLFELNNGNCYSNITFDRLDNDKCHSIDNLQIICNECNTRKSNK